MNDLVGPVDWGAHDGTLVERILSIMLLREHRGGWRRNPSQGDAGVDLAIPIPGGFEVIQIKSYTGLLTSRRKSDIAESLRRVVEDPELPAPVLAWRLALPMDPSKQAEKWFSELTRDAPFECEWKGQWFVDSLAARHPDVIDYFLRDGKARLERRLRDLRNVADLLSEPIIGPRAGEVLSPLADFFDALNGDDPFYRYEFELSKEPPPIATENARAGVVMAFSQTQPGKGCVTVRVYARYAQATEDCPIRLGFGVDLEKHPHLRDELREAFSFGATAELPYGTVKDFVLDAPGGLSVAAATAAARIGPSIDETFKPYILRFRVTSPEGSVVAETRARAVRRKKGKHGVDVRLEELGGAFSVVLRLVYPNNIEGTLNLHHLEIQHAGKSPSSVVAGVQVLNALKTPNHLTLLLEHGPGELATLECGDEEPPITNAYRRVIEALDSIQQHTPNQLSLPDEEQLTRRLARRILEIAALLKGAMTSGKWDELKLPLRASVVESFLDAPGIAIEQPLILELGKDRIDLGVYTLKLRSIRILNAKTIRKQVHQVDPEEVIVLDLRPGPESDRYEALFGPLLVPDESSPTE